MLGRNMLHALRFARKVDGWMGFSNDRATRNAIARLEKRGLVESNQFGQFRITEKGKGAVSSNLERTVSMDYTIAMEAEFTGKAPTRYTLVCVAPDGDYRTEHNIFADDGEFDSIQDAWKRNDDIGSRWYFYPLRLVESDGVCVSVQDGAPQELVGMPVQEAIGELASMADMLL